MNIFVVNPDPVISAQELCDQHVVKMPTESFQMLSMVHNYYSPERIDFLSQIYKTSKGHSKHPCTLWAIESSSNYRWLYKHAIALCEEYTRRYRKVHGCIRERKLDTLLKRSPENQPDLGLTSFAQAVPEEYREEDSVNAYQKFYNLDKSRFARWKYTSKPAWYQAG